MNKLLKEGLEKLELGDLSSDYFGCKTIFNISFVLGEDEHYISIRYHDDTKSFQMVSGKTNPQYYGRDDIDELSKGLDEMLKRFIEMTHDSLGNL